MDFKQHKTTYGYSEKHISSITKIQSLFRGQKARSLLCKKHAAARILQRFFRTILFRKRCARRRALLSKRGQIQAKVTRLKERIRRLEQTKAEMSLVDATRVREWERKRLDKAAVIIQKRWRGILARQFVKRIKEQGGFDTDSDDEEDVGQKQTTSANYTPLSEEEKESLSKMANSTEISNETKEVLDKITRQLKSLKSEAGRSTDSSSQADRMTRLKEKFQKLDTLLIKYYNVPESERDIRKKPPSAYMSIRADPLADVVNGVPPKDLVAESEKLIKETNELVAFLDKCTSREALSAMKKEEIPKVKLPLEEAKRVKRFHKDMTNEKIGPHRWWKHNYKEYPFDFEDWLDMMFPEDEYGTVDANGNRWPTRYFV